MRNSDTRQLRVLGLIPPCPTGSTYARFFAPLANQPELEFSTLPARMALERTRSGWSALGLALKDVDLVLLPQRVLPLTAPDGSTVDLLAELRAACTERQISVLYSTDDHIELAAASNPVRDQLNVAAANTGQLMEMSDGAIVTTEPLADAVQNGRTPIKIIPNSVSTKNPQRPAARGDDRPKVGWAGSASHLDDLLMIAPEIARAQQQSDFTFEIFGLTDGLLTDQAKQVRAIRSRLAGDARVRADRLLELVSVLAGIDYVHRPFVAVDRFATELAACDWDIGICPLTETEFNRCKSAIKYYEYAICGTLTLASDRAPYQDPHCIRVSDEAGAWADQISTFLAEPKLAREHLEAQQQWVRAHRALETWRPVWHSTLRSFAHGQSTDSTQEISLTC